MIKGDYYISTDNEKMDILLIQRFLNKRNDWAKSWSFEDVEKCLMHSICFGVFNQDRLQVGFARVITDYMALGHILDFFIIESHHGLGLSRELISGIINHEELGFIRKWMISTSHRKKFYQQFGFTALAKPQEFMELTRGD
jgi:hypothetical protein